jgi:hypothetical protein
MAAPKLLVASVFRDLLRVLPARDSTSPACEEDERAPEHEPGTTKWDVLKYAIDSTARTVRLGVLVLVIAVAVLIALRAGVSLF